VAFVIAKPADSPQKDNPKAVPVLPGPETNWGTLEQSGRDFRIYGHPQWEAVGKIRDDGRVTLIWTYRADGEACPGVYAIENGNLKGLWGHAGRVAIDEKGDLVGEVMSDVTYKVKN
jgi:hypothetical protein